MGRQAYLTRLALGRSPFEEPELTESGEFILGSHAHDLDNQRDGYVQQFDDKGHPENRAAKAAAKEFRRAKNDVLETIGVVVKKEKQESKRRQSTEKKKVAALLRENSYGPWLRAADSGITLLSLWWLMSLRSRFQTFRSFSSLPLLEIIKSEIRLLGPSTFFSSGLLARLVTIPISLCRQSLVEITADSMLQEATTPADDTINLKRYATHMNVLCQILDFTLFAIATPTLMFSDLQILQLIPPSAKPSLISLIPFARGSPIRPPRLSRPLSMTTVLQTGLDIIESPIMTFWLYDCARYAVEAFNYRIVRATVPRPDLPDKLSKIAAHKSDEDEDAIPGLWLRDGPTLLERIQYEAGHVLDWFRSWKNWGKKDPTLQMTKEAIRLRSLAIERDILMGPTTAHRTRPSESMALEIRRHAARLAWESQRQTPPEDIDAWIGLPPPQQTNSTNTPDPEELFTTAEAFVGTEMVNDRLQPRELLVDSTPLEPQQPDDQSGRLPVEASLEETPNSNEPAHIPIRHVPHDTTFPAENSDAFWELFLHNYTTRVHTSSDGHALMWENADSDATPPPVRRARRLTNEDDFSRSFSRSHSRNRERLGSGGGTRELTRHRVTSLSNYPADAFACHTRMVLTTLMMFPLESLYLRALARGFLQNPATRTGAVATAVGIGADVRRLGAWFGGEGGLMGRLRYAGVMTLIWGIQAVVSAGIWGVGATVAVWIGRSAFGWGRN